MRKYELLCLLKAGYDMENTDQSVASIEEIIKNMGGNVLEVNKLGRKKLAYEIAGNRDAFNVTYIMEFEPDKLKELKRSLKLNDIVIRDFITIIKETSKTAAVSQ